MLGMSSGKYPRGTVIPEMRGASGNGTRAIGQWAERAAKRLSDDPRVRLVYLFGSAADSTIDRVRDIDLAILTHPLISTAELLRIRADLGGVGTAELDLVSLNRASVTLRHQVAEHGLCLFARGPDDEIEFVTRARSRFWDFSPYLTAQWELAGQRLEARRHGPQT